jgi:hypothetical protein
MAGSIWWGDILRAAAAMDVTTPQEFQAVARALGFEVSEASSESLVPPSRNPRPEHPAVRPATGKADRQEQHDQRHDPAGHPLSRSLLQPIGERPVGGTLTDGPILARPAPITQPAPLRHQRLLSPRSTNGILQYLLSRLVMDGPADVAALVETIAAGRPSVVVPRRPRRTLRFGAQVLVDLGDSMRPFRLDQTQIVESVRGLVGPASTAVHYFADAPLRNAGRGPRSTWRAYRPPPPGIPVLLLTEFGIGGDRLSPQRSSTAEWLAFFELLRRRGSSSVALVPYPPARWPRWLHRQCPALQWDRHVTVGQARAAMT